MSPVSPVVQEMPDQQDHPETQEIEARPVPSETKAPSEHPDLLELTEKMDPEEQPVPQDQSQKLESLDLKDHKVTMVHPVPLVIPVHEEDSVTPDLPELLEPKDKLEIWDQLVFEVQLVLKEAKA